jgi:hypothetical protein
MTLVDGVDGVPNGHLVYSESFEEAEAQHQEMTVSHGGVNDPRATNGIQKVSIWHEQIVDWFLQNPGGTQQDCADHFQKTQGWISIVMGSDAFREFRDLRMRNHQDHVSRSLVSQVQGLARSGLKELTTRLNGEEVLPIGQVRDITELAVKSLGMGQGGRSFGLGEPNGVQVQVNNFNGVSADVLANARAKMARVIEHNTQVTEHDAARIEDATVEAEVVDEMCELIKSGEEQFIRLGIKELMEFEVEEGAEAAT